MEIEMIERKTLKEKPAAGSELGFGKLFTDYMFSMVYEEGRGWHDARSRRTNRSRSIRQPPSCTTRRAYSRGRKRSKTKRARYAFSVLRKISAA